MHYAMKLTTLPHWFPHRLFPSSGTGINDATYGKYLTTIWSQRESPNGYVRSPSRYGTTATKGGEHNATTNMDKTKLQDSNTINCFSK
jgi:hypothetical protein